MNTIETQIESIVDSILSDYTHGRDIDKVDLKRHPEKEVVIDVITKLLRIVFPGYFLDNTKSERAIEKCGFEFLFEAEHENPGHWKKMIRTYIQYNPHNTHS